jgi:hypothetical protein
MIIWNECMQLFDLSPPLPSPYFGGQVWKKMSRALTFVNWPLLKKNIRFMANKLFIGHRKKPLICTL